MRRPAWWKRWRRLWALWRATRALAHSEARWVVLAPSAPDTAVRAKAALLAANIAHVDVILVELSGAVSLDVEDAAQLLFGPEAEPWRPKAPTLKA